MEQYKHDFIEFALSRKVLKFGEFTLKSGRKSPYFFNAGLFNTGKDLAKLGEFYAQAIQASGLTYDVLFGPAYKGIPIATTVSVALFNKYGGIHQFALTVRKRRTMAKGATSSGLLYKVKSSLWMTLSQLVRLSVSL